MKSMSWLKSVSLSAAILVVLAGCAGNATERSTGQYVDDKTISTKVKTAESVPRLVHWRLCGYHRRVNGRRWIRFLCCEG